jgi:hypothetical protein
VEEQLTEEEFANILGTMDINFGFPLLSYFAKTISRVLREGPVNPNVGLGVEAVIGLPKYRSK